MCLYGSKTVDRIVRDYLNYCTNCSMYNFVLRNSLDSACYVSSRWSFDDNQFYLEF